MTQFPQKKFARESLTNSMYVTARKAEYLSVEKEKELFHRAANGDHRAFDLLVASHIRMVMSFVTKRYRNCGQPIEDIISAGNIGLITAARRFDVTMPNRFATYAMWWVRAEINEYLVQNSSTVRIPNSAKTRSLFFNITRLIAELEAKGMNHYEIMSEIAENHELTRDQLEHLLAARSAPRSLDAPVSVGRGEDGMTFQDSIADDAPNAEEILVAQDEMDKNVAKLNDVISKLNEREEMIFRARRMKDDPDTLEVLGNRFSVSRERIRQIEEKAAKKVFAGMMEAV